MEETAGRLKNNASNNLTAAESVVLFCVAELPAAETRTHNMNAKFGYIITGSRDVTGQSSFGLGAIDIDGDYEPARADSTEGNVLAIYPDIETAEAEMRRAAGESDPVVFDGLEVTAAWEAVAKNDGIAQCVVYDFVCFPKGRPERTDWQNAL